MLPWLIPAALVVAGLLLWWQRHRRFVALRWPPQHPNGFVMSCKTYLRRQGWRVWVAKEPGDFMIEAGGRKAMVWCRAHGFALSPLLVEQLNRLHRIRPRIEKLVICYDKPDDLVLAGLKGPRLIRYQSLAEITPGKPEPAQTPLRPPEAVEQVPQSTLSAQGRRGLRGGQ